MKYLILLLFNWACLSAMAQQEKFIVHNLSLPKEVAFYDNQFSGLFISGGKLFLLSESRLQDKAEAKLYAINLSDLDRKLTDTSYKLPYRKYHLYELEVLRDSINAMGDKYEGLEAFIIAGNTVYFSVETDTPSPNCYLLKASLNDTAIILNTAFLLPLPKPVAANGSHIYNAGFEAMVEKHDSIFAFFEFNYFPAGNRAYLPGSKRRKNDTSLHSLPVSRLPFRITDITYAGNDHFTAINYFFNGEGKDTVYRMPAGDTINNKLIKDKAGYRSYCRLVDIVLREDGFAWKPLWELPATYMNYNWEGIAAYRNGYFMVNDKYSPQRPFQSVLLYLKKNQ